LAEQATRENDPGQRRYLIDLARNYVNVADALMPLPPEDEQLFRVRHAEADKARVTLIEHLRSRAG
jgi:hypothetical protein